MSPPRPTRASRHLGWRLVALLLVVLVAHLFITAWLAQALSAAQAALATPARLEVLYVRDMDLAAAAPPQAAPPTAPPPVARAARAVAPAPAKVASVPESDRVIEPVVVADAAPRPATTLGAAAPLDSPAELDVADPEPGLPEPITPERNVPEQGALAQSAPSQTAPNQVAPNQAMGAPSGPIEPPAPRQAASAPLPNAAASGANPSEHFDWPVSTRLSYRLTGHVRGEVHGDAQVEWLRQGNRYQVHLDVTVGLHVAPLMTRRMSSDGEITVQGLSPRRYDQDTKIGFGDRRRAVVLFETDAVRLANGQRRERPPGVQDTASQFIQLIYLFSTRPQALRPGDQVEVPLALPHKLSVWTYDVLQDDTVYTDFGPVEAVHLKPRRDGPPGSDLSAEIWLAPGLRYLPARIRIHQDEQTHIDLKLSRKPELAAR